MDIQEYISSGILESYVLGLCTEDEVKQVESMMRENSIIKEEVFSIQQTLEMAAIQSNVQPASHLKSKIWNVLQKEEAPIINLNRPEEQVKTMNSRTWLAYAASFALLFGASSVAIFFYAQNRRIENSLAVTEQSNQKLKIKIQQSKDSLVNLGQKMNLLAQAGTKKIMLSGVPTAKNAQAVVFWNASEKMVMLTDVNLPSAPSDKQYQLWALVDGVPVDAGTLSQDMASNQLVEMKKIDRSQAFAITLEPKGGSTAPHLEALCVIGNV